MRYTVILLALALPVLTVADRSPSSPEPRTATVVSPGASIAARYSPERLQQLRQSLVAQIAVRDDAEGVRAATDQEAAALGVAAPGAAQAVALPDGGMALRTDGSQLSLAVAEMEADGRVRVSERSPNAGLQGPMVKGGAHVR